MPCPTKPKVTWLDKVNFIRSYAVNGCGTSLKIWVETGIAADQNLICNLAGISLTEAVYTLLRPKGLRVERHSGGRGTRNIAKGKGGYVEGKWVSNGEVIPDTAELVSENVRLLGDWAHPTYGALGTYLFDIAKPLIHTAYYLTLVSAATDFAYDWYSGILLNPGSQCARGRFEFRGFRNSDIGTAYYPVFMAQTIFPPHGAIRHPDGIGFDEGTWIVELTMQVQNTDPHGSDASAFAHIELGLPTSEQCGGFIHIDCPAHTISAEKKLVIKVRGPDVLNVWLSTHTAHFGDIITEVALQVAAFII